MEELSVLGPLLLQDDAVPRPAVLHAGHEGIHQHHSPAAGAFESVGVGPAFSFTLEDAGCVVHDVPASGIGAAAADSDLVLLESECIGPDEALVTTGSRAAAATGREAGLPVWLVGGVGRQLPARMWDGVIERIDRGEPWEREHEVVPLRLIDQIITPVGPRSPTEAARSVDCPVAPELFGSG